MRGSLACVMLRGALSISSIDDGEVSQLAKPCRPAETRHGKRLLLRRGLSGWHRRVSPNAKAEYWRPWSGWLMKRGVWV
jgi:hypothetical protein